MSEPNHQIALRLYQVVLVGITLWLGVSQYVLKSYESLEEDDNAILAVIAGGFLALLQAHNKLSKYLIESTDVAYINDALLAIETFALVLAGNVIWAIISRSSSHEKTIRHFLKALVLGLITYGISYMGAKVF